MGRGVKFAYGNVVRQLSGVRSMRKSKHSDESDEDYVFGADELDDGSSDGRCARRNVIRRRKRERIRSKAKRKGSDGSDEDYVIGKDESDDDVSEEYYASSPEASDVSFSATTTSCSGESTYEGIKCQKPKQRKATVQKKSGAKRRKPGVSRVLGDPEDDDEFIDDDDEEFMPDADDCWDGGVGKQIRSKSIVKKRLIGRKASSKCRKTKRHLNKRKTQKEKTSKEKSTKLSSKKINSDDDFLVEDKPSSRNNNRSARRRKKKIIYSDPEFVCSGSSDDDYDESEEERELIRELKDNGKVNNCMNSRKKRRRIKRKGAVHSDSDFVISSSSDFDGTISEEERDFIRELAENGNISTCLSSLPKILKLEGASQRQERKTLAKKGKEKMDDMQVDNGKQVCGICLSEEQRGTIRGLLDSCIHYFCFKCIMEWSKVETRCPVCKQRFSIIKKIGKLDAGIGLRRTVIKVSRRDQVYKPSDEELRGYLDPYENVVCMECQQGGDDSLMLLCDICDSPAHTYCVGLGREVPEGNWYCEGCRSSEPVTSNSPASNLASHHNLGVSALPNVASDRRTDVEVPQTPLPPPSASQNSIHSPDLFSPEIDVEASPRFPGENVQIASTIPAATVSGRRRLRLRIHNLISSSVINHSTQVVDRNNDMPSANLASDVAISRNEHHAAIDNMNSHGSSDTHSVLVGGGLLGSARLSNSFGRSPFDAISVRTSHRRKQLVHDLNAAPPYGPADDSLSFEQVKNSSNMELSNQNCRCDSSKSSAYMFPCTSGEGSSSYTAEEAKEQVQAMVKRHLKLLTRDTQLERSAFKDIVGRSTHTVLAAFGLSHSTRIAIDSFLPPLGCAHPEENTQMGLVKGYCSCCFDSFVRDVVLKLVKTTIQAL